MDALTNLLGAFGPPAVVLFGGMLASLLGVPQGIGFEYTLLFEGLAVALAAAAVVITMVGFGLAIRQELARS